jgi:formylglycine-generating enzyme required for sulfatase activity
MSCVGPFLSQLAVTAYASLFCQVDSKVLELAKDVKLKFVWIKPGDFVMGSPENEAGHDYSETQHLVRIGLGFWMQATETTQAQWESIMGANPSRFEGDSRRPVERVSWNDCQEYLKRLNDRLKFQRSPLNADLPTEAEWEYSCRAGSAEAYCFGHDKSRLSDFAWYSGCSESSLTGQTHPVGELKPNDWGLYDMHGNVSEWCKDWYGEYETPRGEKVIHTTSVKDPQGPPRGEYRVLRGGAWNGSFSVQRSAVRFKLDPGGTGSMYGFRIVLRGSKD